MFKKSNLQLRKDVVKCYTNKKIKLPSIHIAIQGSVYAPQGSKMFENLGKI